MRLTVYFEKIIYYFCYDHRLNKSYYVRIKCFVKTLKTRYENRLLKSNRQIIQNRSELTVEINQQILSCRFEKFVETVDLL